MHLLKIKILDNCPNKDYVYDYYSEKINKTSYNNDCGIDIIFPDDKKFLTNKVTKCGMGISCEFIPNNLTESGPFDLIARSSISNTPLILTNSVGIFDPGYRGEIIVPFRCFIDREHQSTVNNFSYVTKKGDRLVQIVSPDRKPIKIEIVQTLSETTRGSNGFGSTDNFINN